MGSRARWVQDSVEVGGFMFRLDPSGELVWNGTGAVARVSVPGCDSHGSVYTIQDQAQGLQASGSRMTPVQAAREAATWLRRNGHLPERLGVV